MKVGYKLIKPTNNYIVNHHSFDRPNGCVFVPRWLNCLPFVKLQTRSHIKNNKCNKKSNSHF